MNLVNNLKQYNNHQSPNSKFVEGAMFNREKLHWVTLHYVMVSSVLCFFMLASQAQAKSWYDDKAVYPGEQRYEDDIYNYFTQYYQKVHQNVQAGTATPQELWDYNILLRQHNARDFLKIELSETQATAEADKLLQQTYQQRLPSAVLQTAYVNIEAGIGKPIYKKIDRAYYPEYFAEVQVTNPDKLSEGLADMIELLKKQQKYECYADYNPLVRYPYFNNTPNTHPKMYIVELNTGLPQWTENPTVIEHLELKIGNILDNFPRSAVQDYPKIKRQLDLISLRNKVHCKSEYHNLSIIGGYLVEGSRKGIKTYDYAQIMLPTAINEYDEKVFISVFTELMAKPEFLSVFEQRVSDKNKKQFVQDREQLINEYRKVFGD